MLPNFFVVGAQKSATTSLHYYLNQHPEIYLPKQKESKFFAEDKKYNLGLEYYEQEYFSDRKNEKEVGEIDPDYMYFDQAIERISVDLDINQIKFIFILRNPVDRAFSHYLMTYRRGLEQLTFEEAIKRENERINTGFEAKMHYSYVSRGFYLNQINKLLKHVDKSQSLVILTEDIENNPAATLKNIYNFLDVSSNHIPNNIQKKFHKSMIPKSLWLLNQINQETKEKKLLKLLLPSKYLRMKLRTILKSKNLTEKHNISLSDSDKIILSSIFREPNAKLAEFLKRDLSHWNYV